MYHVVGTGITIATLYLIFLFFRKSGIISAGDNRKIWNLILGITFVITGTAGIILAIRVNYRLKGDFFDQLLRWHVETGIAFSFTGLIHFISHFTYFRNLFAGISTDNKTEPEILTEAGGGITGANLFFLGFVSTSVQLLLLREIINITGGYELIAGTYFAAWLINSAAGSFYAGRTGKVPLNRLNIILAITPLLSVILTIISGRVFLHTGETPSFLGSILITTVILFPVCFISGFIFIKLLEQASEKGYCSSGGAFSIETAGGILSGIAVTLLSSGVLDTYQILLTVILLFATFLSLTLIATGKRLKSVLVFIWILLILIVLWFSPAIYVRQLMLPGIKVTGTGDSPYGNITTGEYRGEHFTYYNHRLARWQYDETEREESVHYALLQHREPKRILVISGDIFSLFPELMKYGPEKIVFVERDPELLKPVKKEMADKKNLIIFEDDAFRFMRNTKDKFDAIIMNLPPPSTLQLNRYYTENFFRLVHSRLDTSGIFSCSPGIFENYFNEESANLYSIIYSTVRSVFRNVIPVGGNRLYFIASDGNLQTAICSLYKTRAMQNVYVNCDYLDDELIRMKSVEIQGLLESESKLNTLSSPLATYFFQRYNLTRTPGKTIPALLLLIIMFILPSATVSVRNYPMYAAACTLAGFEIISLLSIQSSMGNMYQLTGLVLSTIMAGLAAGSGTNIKAGKELMVRIILIIMTCFYIVVYLIYDYLSFIKPGITYTIAILFLGFIPSYLTGMLFRVISAGRDVKRTASAVYSSDLTGSAMGFIVVSAILLPLAGTVITVLAFAGFTFTAFIFAFVRCKN